jgi:hypothetical protein
MVCRHSDVALPKDREQECSVVVFTIYEIHLNRQIEDHIVLCEAKGIADKQGPLGEFDQDGLPGYWQDLIILLLESRPALEESRTR